MQLADNQASYVLALGALRGAVINLATSLRLVDHCGHALSQDEDAGTVEIAALNVRFMTEELRALCVQMPGFREMLWNALSLDKGAK